MDTVYLIAAILAAWCCVHMLNKLFLISLSCFNNVIVMRYICCFNTG